MLTAVVKNSYPIRAATETTKITRDALKYNLDSNDKKNKTKKSNVQNEADDMRTLKYI